MAATTPKMGLKVWNLQTDSYDHIQLAENFAKIDQHRHTEGEGEPIPTGGIEDGAISSGKIGTEQVTTTKIADQSITSPKLELIRGSAAASEALAMTGSFADIPGCTYTAAEEGFYLCFGVFDVSSTEALGIFSGALVVDGSVQSTQLNFASRSAGSRVTMTGIWQITTTGSGKVIKLQGKKSAGSYTTESLHTKISVVRFG